MDVSTISPTRPEWIQRLCDADKEVQKTDLSITLCPRKIRRHIWKMCERLELDKHGIPGQACDLLERFLAKKVFKKLESDLDGQAIEMYLIEVKLKVKLIVGCCILLAFKMHKRSSRNDMQQLIFGQNYTTHEIVKMESEVFQALDFYIPSTTTVEIAQVLAKEVNVSNRVFEEIDNIVSRAELHKPAIVKKVQWVADYNGTAGISRLHLAAGGVAAACLCRCRSDPAPQLAQLTQASHVYITTIAVAIVRYISQEQDE